MVPRNHGLCALKRDSTLSSAQQIGGEGLWQRTVVPAATGHRSFLRRRITADMLIGLLDAAVESLARRPLLPEEDEWAQQELLPPILPVSCPE